jgi:hypothetical protein
LPRWRARFGRTVDAKRAVQLPSNPISNFSARLARTNLAERSPAGSVRNTRALDAALLRHPDILKKNSQPPFDSSLFRFETKCGFWS